MDFKLQQHKLMQLSSRFNLMTVIVLGLLISNVMIAGLLWLATYHQRIEVTPFFSGSSYTKSRNAVDESYLKLMSENFIYSRLNVTPETVKENHKRLLKFVGSHLYRTFAAQLAKEEALVIQQKISSHFEITDINVDSQSLQCMVKGILRRSVGFRELKATTLQYKLQFRYSLDRLSLENFTREDSHEVR